MANKIRVDLEFSANTSKAKKDIQDLQSTLNKALEHSVNSSGINIAPQLKEAQRQAIELGIALEKSTNFDTGKLNLNSFISQLKQSGMTTQSLFKSLRMLGDDGKQAFNQMANAVINAETKVWSLSSGLQKLANTFVNTMRYQVSNAILNSITSTITGTISHVKELDKALTDIRIVTGKSTAEMAKFTKTANAAAQALSVTTKQYAEASLIYFQQGLNASEVKERADITIKLANATGESAETVSNWMTAVWNNFDDGSQSLEYYADVLAKLGAATASSADEIANGLSKFSAVADTVGLSYEYAASMLATITAETRESADVVGTALKTIFSRMEGLKLGETLDDGTTLNKYSAALASIGVNIKDANGELKDMDDILDSTAARWNLLSKDQQVALAQSVAGVRQYNQFIAMMDTWDVMQDNVELSKEANGALDEMQGIYEDSVEGQQKRAAAMAEELKETLLNPDLLKDFYKGLGDITSFVTKLVKSFGGLPGILMQVATLLTKIYKPQITTFFRNTGYAVQDLGLSFKNFFTGKGFQSDRLEKEKARVIQLQKDLVANEDGGVAESQITEKIAEMKLALLKNEKNLTAEQKLSYELGIQMLETLKEKLKLQEKEIENEREKNNLAANNLKNKYSGKTKTEEEKNKTKNDIEALQEQTTNLVNRAGQTRTKGVGYAEELLQAEGPTIVKKDGKIENVADERLRMGGEMSSELDQIEQKAQELGIEISDTSLETARQEIQGFVDGSITNLDKLRNAFMSIEAQMKKFGNIAIGELETTPKPPIEIDTEYIETQSEYVGQMQAGASQAVGYAENAKGMDLSSKDTRAILGEKMKASLDNSKDSAEMLGIDINTETFQKATEAIDDFVESGSEDIKQLIKILKDLQTEVDKTADKELDEIAVEAVGGKPKSISKNFRTTSADTDVDKAATDASEDEGKALKNIIDKEGETSYSQSIGNLNDFIDGSSLDDTKKTKKKEKVTELQNEAKKLSKRRAEIQKNIKEKEKELKTEKLSSKQKKKIQKELEKERENLKQNTKEIKKLDKEVIKFTRDLDKEEEKVKGGAKDIDKLGDEMQEAARDSKALAQQNAATAKEQSNLNRAVQDGKEDIDNYNNEIDKGGNGSRSFSETLSNVFSGAMSMAAGLQTLKSSVKELNLAMADGKLEGDELLSTFMSMGPAIMELGGPMLKLIGWIGQKMAAGKAAATQAQADANKETLAEGQKQAAHIATGSTAVAAWIAAQNYVAAAIGIAALAAVGASVVFSIVGGNKDAEAEKEAKAKEESAEEARGAAEAMSEIGESSKGLDSAIEGFKKLKEEGKSTAEQVGEINKAYEELLETARKLATEKGIKIDTSELEQAYALFQQGAITIEEFQKKLKEFEVDTAKGQLKSSLQAYRDSNYSEEDQTKYVESIDDFLEASGNYEKIEAELDKLRRDGATSEQLEEAYFKLIKEILNENGIDAGKFKDENTKNALMANAPTEVRSMISSNKNIEQEVQRTNLGVNYNTGHIIGSNRDVALTTARILGSSGNFSEEEINLIQKWINGQEIDNPDLKKKFFEHATSLAYNDDSFSAYLAHSSDEVKTHVKQTYNTEKFQTLLADIISSQENPDFSLDFNELATSVPGYIQYQNKLGYASAFFETLSPEDQVIANSAINFGYGNEDSWLKTIEEVKDQQRENLIIQEAEGLGYSEKVFEDYANTLASTTENLEANSEASKKVAVDNLKLNDGLKKISESWKDVSEAIASGNTQAPEYIKAINSIKNTIKDAFNVDVDESFITGNFEVINRMLQGEEGALADFQEALANQKIQTLEIVPVVNTDTGDARQDLQNFVNELNSDLEFGTEISLALGEGSEVSQDYIKSLQAMLNLGQITEAQLNEVLAAKGFSLINVDYEWIDGVTVYDENGKQVKQKIRVPQLNGASLVKNSDTSTIDPSIYKDNKKSGSDKQKKNLEDEIERYHDITKELEKIERQLARVETAKERAFGANKLQFFDEQIKLSEKQLESYKKELEEINSYLQKDMANAMSWGIEIDSETGLITNYDEIITQKVNEYNSGSLNEESYSQFKSDLQQYEETLALLEDKQNSFIENQNALSSLKLEKIQYGIEVKIQVIDNDLNYIEYQLGKIEDDAFAAAEAINLIGKQTEANLNKVNIYAEGIKQVFSETFSDEEINKILNGDLSVLEGKELTQEQIDVLTEYKDGVLEANTELLNLQTTLQEYVVSAFEAWNEELQKNIDKLGTYGEILSSYRDIVDLMGQDALGISDELMKNMSQANIQNTTAQVDAARQKMESNKQILADLERDYADIRDSLTEEDKKKWEETIETVKQSALDAEAEFLSTFSSGLQTAADEFSRAMEQIAKTFEKAMSGSYGSFEALSTVYDQYTQANERYLDDYAKIYELSKLNRQVVKSIDEKDSVLAKQRLRDIQEEINKLQASNAKMTQYEVNELRARYELRLAEIALEEAQNAKNQVRMQRNAEGEWSYVYTANQNSIDTAQQVYEDKLYSYQNLIQQRISEMESSLMNLPEEFSNAMKSINEDLTLSAEERLVRMTETKEFYLSQDEYLTEQLEISIDFSKSLYEKDWKNYSTITGYKISIDKNWKDNFNETTLSILTDYETIEEMQEQFVIQTDNMITDLNVEYEEWQKNVDRVMQAGGTSVANFGKKVEDTVIKVGQKTKELSGEVQTTASEMQTAMSTTAEITAALSTQYSSYIGTVTSAAETMVQTVNGVMGYYSTMITSNTNLSTSFEKIAQAAEAAAASISRMLSTSGGGGGGGATKKETSTFAIYGASSYAVDQDTTNKRGTVKPFAAFSGKLKGYRIASDGAVQVFTNDNEMFYVNAMDLPTLAAYSNLTLFTEDTMPKNWRRLSFDTGGYTGEWGADGRIAMLHQKEIVLNAKDTENFLAAVNIVREIANVIDLNTLSQMNRLSNFNSTSITPVSQAFEQEVTIHAEFPNATNHSEIEEAFDTLLNRASQFANRKN